MRAVVTRTLLPESRAYRIRRSPIGASFDSIDCQGGRHEGTSQILHRRALGRAARKEDDRRHQSGHRGSSRSSDARHRRRRRPSRGGRPQGVRDVFADDEARPHRADRAHPELLPGTTRRARGNRDPRDGSAQVAGHGGASACRHGPHRADSPSAQGLRVRRAERYDTDRQGTGRRLRLHHSVELADQSGDVQGDAGAGRRLHDGAEAERDHAAERHHPRRDLRQGGRARRSVQPRQRRWADGWRGDRVAPRHRHGLVHGLDARRSPGGEERG